MTWAESIRRALADDAFVLYGVDYAQGYGIGRPQPVSEWLGQDAVRAERV